MPRAFFASVAMGLLALSIAPATAQAGTNGYLVCSSPAPTGPSSDAEFDCTPPGSASTSLRLLAHYSPPAGGPISTSAQVTVDGTVVIPASVFSTGASGYALVPFGGTRQIAITGTTPGESLFVEVVDDAQACASPSRMSIFPQYLPMSGSFPGLSNAQAQPEFHAFNGESDGVPSHSLSVEIDDVAIVSSGQLTLPQASVFQPLNLLASNTFSMSLTDASDTGDFDFEIIDRDVTPPVLLSVNPVPAMTRDQQVTVSGQIDDASAGVSINGQQNSVGADGHFSLQAFLAQDGDNLLTVEAIDSCQNTSEPQTFHVFHDGTPPTLALVSPDPSTLVQGQFLTNQSAPTLVVRFSDLFANGAAGSGVDTSSLVLKVDGQGTYAPTAIDTTASTATWTLPALADGFHNVLVSARDLAGNSTALGVALKIDSTGPGIWFSQPQSGQQVSSDALVISLSFGDTGSGATGVNSNTAQVLWGTSAGSITNPLTLSSVSSSGASALLDFSSLGLSDGTYYLSASVADQLGNVGYTTVSFSLVRALQNAPPNIWFNQPQTGAYITSDTFTVDVGYSSNPSVVGIDTTTLGLFWGTSPDNITTPVSFSSIAANGATAVLDFNSLNLTDGTYYLLTSVADKAGFTNSRTLSFTLSRSSAPTGPNVWMIQPQNGQVITDNTFLVEVGYSSNSGAPSIDTSSVQLYWGTSATAIDHTMTLSSVSSGEATALFDFNGLGLPDGIYFLSASVADVQGHVASSMLSFTLARSTQAGPTQLWVVSPALDVNNKALSNSPGAFVEFHFGAFAGIDLSTVHLTSDGGDIPACPDFNTFANCLQVRSDRAWASLSFGSDGAHSFVASAADVNGQSASASFTLSLDLHPPQVSIECSSGQSCPLEYGITNQSAFTWVVRHPDYDVQTPGQYYFSGIRKVQGDIDSGTPNAIHFEQSYPPGTDPTLASTEWPVSGLADGTHFVQLSVTDNAGNVGQDWFSFVVDTVPPTVSEIDIYAPPADPAPPPPYITDSRARLVSVSYSDSGASVSEPELVLTHTLTPPGSNTPGVPEQVSPGVFQFEEGLHTFTAEAIDQAGNVSAPKRVSFVVDRSAPIVTNVTFTPGAATQSLVADCADNVSGIASASLTIGEYLNNTVVTHDPIPLTVENGHCSKTDLSLPDGEYNFSVAVTDQAGNVGIGWTTAILDRIPPTILLDYPTPTTQPGMVRVATPTADNPLGWLLNSGDIQMVYIPSDNVSGFDYSSFRVVLDGDESHPVCLGSDDPYCGSGAEPLQLHLEDGLHHIRASIADGVGNVGTLDTFYMVDTQAPGLTLSIDPVSPGTLTPSDSGLLSTGTSVIAHVVVNEAGTGLGWFGASGFPDPTNVPALEPAVDGTYTADVPLTLTEGQHFLSLYATDLAANLSETDTLLVVDTTPPAAGIKLPDLSNGSPQFLTSNRRNSPHFLTSRPGGTQSTASTGVITATHILWDENGVDWSRTRVDMSPYIPGVVGPLYNIDPVVGSAQCDISLGAIPENGTYTFTLNAYDLAGNQTLTSTTLIIDRPPASDSGGSGVACASTAAGPVASRLQYTGATFARCGGSLAPSALLTDTHGAPLAGKTIVFALGTQQVSAVTDATGVAAAAITPSGSGSGTLNVSFAGDANANASQLSVPLVLRTTTRLANLGPGYLATGIAQPVQATLTALDGTPIPGETIAFQAAGVTATATTDGSGVATASLSLPSQTSGIIALGASFAGDTCNAPATATSSPTTYTPTSFAIWGGNPGGLSTNQRVNFWGHSWAGQVLKGSDYDSHADFKGYAGSIPPFQSCEASSKSTSSPPLDSNCWTSVTGQSNPPATIPSVIGVLVPTSIGQINGTVYGNVSMLAVVAVDTTVPYAPDPGKPGYGTLLAMFPTLGARSGSAAQMTAVQSQPSSVLPGQSFTASVNLTNPNTTSLSAITVSEKFSGVTPTSASASISSLTAGAHRTVSYSLEAPAITSRQSSESSGAYAARLAASDGQQLSSIGTVSFSDSKMAAGTPVTLASQSILQVPRLSANLYAPASTSPGATLNYTLSVANVGSAPAGSGTAVLTFPDGTTGTVSLSPLAPGAATTVTVPWNVPAVAPPGGSVTQSSYLSSLQSLDGATLTASVAVSWSDAAGNSYGTVDGQASSTERVPVLSLTTASLPSLLPGEYASVGLSLQNTGSGDAQNIAVTMTELDSSVFTAPATSLVAGQSSNVDLLASIPPVPAHQPGETDAQYGARLAALDNSSVSFPYRVTWVDCAGHSYGALVSSLGTQEILPVVTVGITGPAAAQPGDAVTYSVTVTNSGHALASNLAVNVQLPDGSTSSLPVASLAPGASSTVNVNATMPVIAPRGGGESSASYIARLQAANGVPLNTTATVTWQDADSGAYGTLQAQTSTTQKVPILQVSASSASAVLPGQSIPVTFTLQNIGSGTIQNCSLQLSEQTGAPVSVPPFTLSPGQSTQVQLTATVPAVAAKGSGETDAAYAARLAPLDNTVLSYGYTGIWNDSSGNQYGAVTGATQLTEVLPILSLGMTGNATAQPGDALSYTLTVTNSGHAPASQASIVAQLPDGSTRPVSLPTIAAQGSTTASLSAAVPALAGRGASESSSDYVNRLKAADGAHLVATALLAWQDTAATQYGQVQGQVSTTQQVPVLQVTTSALAAMLPGQAATESVTIANIGSGKAQGATFHFTQPGGSVVNVPPFDLAGGETKALQLSAQAPAMTGRGSGETENAYLARLSALDNTSLSFAYDLEWNDQAGDSYGQVDGGVQSTEVLPVLTATLTGPSTAQPGSSLQYNVIVGNSGHADASGLTVSVLLPDGTTAPVSIASVAAGTSSSAAVSGTVPVIPKRAAQETVGAYTTRLQLFDGAALSAVATLDWEDASGSSYGDIHGQATTTEQVPILQVSATSLTSLLVGQSAPVTFTLQNIGTAPAQGATLQLAEPDSTFDTRPAFTLAPGQSTTMLLQAHAPALAPRGTAESDADYAARLAAADNSPLAFAYALAWKDGASDAYGIDDGALSATEVVPNLALNISAPASAEPGDTVPVTVTVTNNGHTEADSLTVVAQLFDGTSVPIHLPPLAPGASATGTAYGLVPSVAPHGSGESNADYIARLQPLDGAALVSSATLSWQDAAGSTYGALDAQATTGQRVPILTVSAQELAVLEPGQSEPALFTVQNLGSGSALNVVLQFTDGSGSTTTLPSFSLAGLTATLVRASASVPVLPPKGAAETDAAYTARLAAADGQLTPFTYALTWQDTCGCSTFGSVTGTVQATEVVPVLNVAVSGTSSAEPGDPLSYTVSVSNSGHAAAVNVSAAVQLPGGTSAPVVIDSVPGQTTTTRTVTGTMPALAQRGSQESASDYVTRLKAADNASIPVTAALGWKDAAGGAYGQVHAQTNTVEQVPVLQVSTTTFNGLAPGATVPVLLTVQNVGSGSAEEALLALNSGSPAPAFSLAPGQSTQIELDVSADEIAPKAAGETDAAYLARLATFDQKSLSFPYHLTWQDPAGDDYGVVDGTAQGAEALPVLSLSLSGPATAEPGDAITYTLQATNNGHAATTALTATVLLPGGASQQVSLAAVAPGGTATGSVAFTVPTIPGRASGESVADYTARLQAADGSALAASAQLGWSDTSGNTYGPIGAQAATTQQVPVLQITASPPAQAQPGTSATITYGIQNIGSGTARNGSVKVTQIGGSITSSPVFTVAAGQTTQVQVSVLIPAVAQKGTGETDAAYLARLAAADNQGLSFPYSLTWHDASNSTFGDISGTSAITEALPVLSASLSAPAGVSPGTGLPITVSLTNNGHATASNVQVLLQLPGGGSQALSFPSIAAGGTATNAATLSVPQISGRAAGESVAQYLARLQTADGTTLSAAANVNWQDANGSYYGELHPAATTTETVPVLTIAAGTIPSLEPGQPTPITFTITNIGHGDAQSAAVSLKQPDGSLVNAAPFSLAAGQSTQVQISATLPAVQPKGSNETDQSYEARLAALDNGSAQFQYDLFWQDAATNSYGSTGASFPATEELPVVAVNVTVPATTVPGATLTYAVTATNNGHATADNVAVTVQMPDGTTTTLSSVTLAPGESSTRNVTATVPLVAPRGGSESQADYLSRLHAVDNHAYTATASVVWADDAAHSFGSVSASATAVEQLPILTLSSQSIASLFPGEQGSAAFAVGNNGAGVAVNAAVQLTDPENNTTQAPAFGLQSGQVTTVSTNVAIPALAPKGTNESDSAYLARLAAADGASTPVAYLVQWQDSAGNSYGPLNGTTVVPEAVPRISVQLTGPDVAFAGDPATYTVKLVNDSSTPAVAVAATLKLPDNSTQTVNFAQTTLDAHSHETKSVTFTLPPDLPRAPTFATATVTWADPVPNNYGAVTSTVTTLISGHNLPPVVDAGANQEITLPANAHLTGTVSDDGFPSGTLTVGWVQVSGPGTAVFSPRNQTQTAVSFSEPGTYVLQLIASDSELTSSANVTVKVDPAPGAAVGANGGDTSSGGSTVNLLQTGNQLQINTVTNAFNRVWVAVSSKGTVVKFDAVSGAIVGEYMTAPYGEPQDPSRTTVDHNGNAWVTNRAGHSVMRIGLVENGQCQDRNGNGRIDTSTGLGDVKNWPNTDNADTNGGVSTAEDECIINYTLVHSSGTRHLSVDQNDDVWVSGVVGRQFDLLDGRTGDIKRTEAGVNYGGYGGLIDSHDVIWSSRPFLRWDPSYPLAGPEGQNWITTDYDSYGLCIDPAGNVWNASLDGTGLIHKYAPDGHELGAYYQGSSVAQGCAIDRNGDVWVASSRYATDANTISHLKNDGTFVGSVVVGYGPTGVAVDAAGKVWSTNYWDGTVSRIDPSLGAIGADGATRIGQTDFTSPYLGGNPYDYSDMTGSTLWGPPVQGTWTVVFDSQRPAAPWGTVRWNALIPGDAALTVKVATSDSPTDFPSPTSVQNGVPFMAPLGQYLQATVTFERSTQGESPILYSLVAETLDYVNTNPPANQAPVVSAGTDRTTTFPMPVRVTGRVTDDGLPGDGHLTMAWTQVSGPGTATFKTPELDATDVSFSAVGDYVLQLSATDGALSASSTMTVHVIQVNLPPVLTMGAGPFLTLPNNVATVSVTATDDGLPTGSSLSYQWTVASGPTGATLATPDHASTQVTFTQSGDYVFKVSVSDGALTSTGSVRAHVEPAPADEPVLNHAMTADFNPNVSIASTSDEALLFINVADDGLPLWPTNPACTGGSSGNNGQCYNNNSYPSWVGVVSGPSRDVVFDFGAGGNGSPGQVVIGMKFPESGVYVVGISGSDGQLPSYAETSVFVGQPSDSNQSPIINMGASKYAQVGQPVTFDATVTDDGLPTGALSTSWDLFSGPGTVTFSDATQPGTSATFSAPGEYVLRLTASDGQLTVWTTTLVEVLGEPYAPLTDPLVLNHPPFVQFGPDLTVSASGTEVLPTLVMFDDGLPYPASNSQNNGGGPNLTLVSQGVISGPSQDVTFDFNPPNAPPGGPAVGLTFPQDGHYVVGLTFTDGQLETHAEVGAWVNVLPLANTAPSIDMGPSQYVQLDEPVTFFAVVTDDGLPYGTLTTQWSKVSGPGTVTFADASQPRTTATFSLPGEYVLQLSATDGELTSWTTTLIEVRDVSSRNPPLVSAGPSQTITFPTSTVTLQGTVSEPGLPSSDSLASQWIMVSGPAPVTFGDSTKPQTTASFYATGTYLLKLTATDGELTGSATVQITVKPPVGRNQPPQVTLVSTTVNVTLPPGQATLLGTVSDDGLPAGGQLTALWDVVSGPGPVSFDTPTQPATHATFTLEGSYLLRLTANDGELATSNTVNVTVTRSANQPPTVTADGPATVELPAVATLTGTVTDDGLPAGILTTHWMQMSGPAAAEFADAAQPNTTVTFPTDGTYVFALVANDTQFSSEADVTIRVYPVNQAPNVSAGGDKTLPYPQRSVALVGTTDDDGLPLGSTVTTKWSLVRGPMPVTFSDPTQLTTTATFQTSGTYLIQLSSTDGQLTNVDQILVTVQPPAGQLPTVAFNAPTDGGRLTAPTDVVGSVSAGDWVLDYALGGDDTVKQTWTVLASGSGTYSGKLATLDPTMMLNGTYQLRLTATTDQGSAYDTTTVSVEKNLKVGVFSMSFNDMTIQLGKLPITVVRTYDSRDKRVGDFGVGWHMSLSDVRLEKSAAVGKDFIESPPAPGSQIQQYCLNTSRSKFVTATFPDGRVYKFSMQLSPSCDYFVPLDVTNVTWQLVQGNGTRGTLEQIGNSQVVVSNSAQGGLTGPLQDAETGELYNPTNFRLTVEDGTVYELDQQQGVTKIIDTNSNSLTFTSGGILSSTGKSVLFTRDALNRITAVTDPTGNSVTYAYDADGNLADVTDRVSNTTTFGYDNQHNNTKIVDPRGVQVAKNVFDDAGRLIQVIDAKGNAINYTHDVEGREETVTNRLGYPHVYDYDDEGNVIQEVDENGAVTKRTYDASGNQLTETNALGFTTTYAYNSLNQKTSMTDPLGNTTGYTWDAFNRPLTTTDPLGHTTTNTYDSSGNLLTVTDALGNVTTNTYDGKGNLLMKTNARGAVTTMQYDGAGHMTQRTDALNHATTYTYDANGNALTLSKARTTKTGLVVDVTNHQYDANGREIGLVAADGAMTTRTYDTNGNISAITNPLNLTTTFTHDSSGNLIQTTFADGTSTSAVFSANNDKVSSTDQLGRVTTYAYDHAHRLTETTYADGSSARTAYDATGKVTSCTNENGHTTSFVYDAGGRKTSMTDATGKTTSYTYTATGYLASVTNANGKITQLVYDDLMRPVSTIYSDGTNDQTEWDAADDPILKVDQAGVETHYSYDLLGQLTTVTDALGHVTSYRYDEAGNRTSQTDANGHLTAYFYDTMGRRLQRTLPGGQTESTTYDPSGNVASRIDFNGHRTTYTYDALNRLASKIPDPFFNAPTVSFTYSSTGARTSMSDSTGTTTYSYDLRDRMLVKHSPQGTLTYIYDAAGNRLSMESDAQNGVMIGYTWDGDERLASVIDQSANGGETRYTYQANGNLSSFVYPNGVQTSLFYDSLNRLTNILGTKNGQAIYGYDYTLDQTGNRLMMTELSGRTVSWGYDSIYRLTSETISGAANVNGSISYTYDAVGNRLGRISDVPSEPSSSSEFGADDTLKEDTYNPNGDTVISSGNSYMYDFDDHLTASSNERIQFAYDGDGNRVAKTIGGVTTTFLIDDVGPTGYTQAVEERADGAVQRSYVYGLGPISLRQFIGGEIVRSYYTMDGTLNVRLLTDAVGDVTDTWDYDAFGIVLSSTGNTPNRILFGGEYMDSDLGLTYLRARWLNTNSGRLLSRDTNEGNVMDPRTAIPYLYANGNPVANHDPSGHITVSEVMCVVALVGISATYIAAFYHRSSFAFILPGFAGRPSLTSGGPIFTPPPPDFNALPPFLLGGRRVTQEAGPGSVMANMETGGRHTRDFIWFHGIVQIVWPEEYYGDPGWDYNGGTMTNPKWTRFTNFNYGAAGSAAGFSPYLLQSLAGLAEQQKSPMLRSPNASGTPFISAPDGDDPDDYDWIDRGINYFGRAYGYN